MSESGISIEATLPLDWLPADSLLPASIESMRQDNIALLQALAAMDGLSHEHEHDTPEAGAAKRLERMESLLDIVLILVAGMARQTAPLPPEKLVRLYSNSIVWQENTKPPQIGQPVLVRLFLNQRIPQPLQLRCVVKEVGNLPESVHAMAMFDNCGEEMDEWLTRTIFRYHRRALHARRQP